MVVSKELIDEGRRQLQEQIDKLPVDRRGAAQAQLDSMTDETIGAMIEQQSSGGSAGEKAAGPAKGVYRMIVDGEIPSKKVEENKEAIAVVEIRPLSKGHVIIIPKKAVQDARALPASVFTLARNVAKRMATKLGASGTEIQSEKKLGEVIMNVVPTYEGKTIGAPYEAKEDELAEVYASLRLVKKPKVEKVKVAKKEVREDRVLKLPRRIP